MRCGNVIVKRKHKSYMNPDVVAPEKLSTIICVVSPSCTRPEYPVNFEFEIKIQNSLATHYCLSAYRKSYDQCSVASIVNDRVTFSSFQTSGAVSSQFFVNQHIHSKIRC